MFGQVRAYQLTDKLRTELDTWERGKHYDDKTCGGISWTAGTFPSTDKFPNFGDDAKIVDREEGVRQVKATWKCPPNQQTVLDVGAGGNRKPPRRWPK